MSLSRRAAAKAGLLWRMAREGDVGPALALARKNLWTTSVAYGLKRDLSVPFETPRARARIRIRELEPGDVDQLLRPKAGDSPKQLARQRRLLAAGIPTCYVAVDPDETPLYMQWLILPEHNHLLAERFGREFPQLADDEVLLEGGFSPKRFRSRAVAPRAASLIAEGAYPEARWALAFVANDNRTVLKLAPLVGFHEYTVRRATWRLFHHRVTFEPLHETHSGGRIESRAIHPTVMDDEQAHEAGGAP
jgi:hypothetical protein